MVPAAVVDATLDEPLSSLSPDVIVDGGNSYYRDGLARAAIVDAALAPGAKQ
jgi:6-phosphogluconate dehydrogenase (decarboxylating)